MALSRRLSRVERELDVQGCIRHWLTEAHAFPSVEAYARWALVQPEARDFRKALLDRVEAAARKANCKRPPSEQKRAITAAHREALFAMNLVMRLNFDAEERLVSLGLAQVALTCWMRELMLREVLAEQGEDGAALANLEGLPGSWHHWRDAASGLLVGLFGIGQAREALEERYLSGLGSLFPETADAWTELVESAEGLYGSAIATHQGEPLEDLRARAEQTRDQDVERVTRMASVVTHGAMGEPEKAKAASSLLLELR